MKPIGVFLQILLFFALPAASTLANDSFAEVGAGGIRFLKQTKISIEEEVLSISPDRVHVKYRFFNPTSRDIVIEVAFPLPEYAPGASEDGPWSGQMENFSVLSDGKPVAYQTETRAIANGNDVTRLLKGYGIDIRTFGESEGDKSLLDQLSMSNYKRLMKAGALGDGSVMLWHLQRIYHWKQRFSAKAVTCLEHTYVPVAGGEYIPQYSENQEWNAKPVSLPECASAWKGTWNKDRCVPGKTLFRSWVRYILTTANNWKGPIGRFTLHVLAGPDAMAMVCSDLPAASADANGLTTSVANYAPTRDLIVCFITQSGPQ